MKTILEVNQEIEDKIKEEEGLNVVQFGSVSKMNKHRKKLSERAVFLRTVIMYLENEPREDFVQKEVEKLTNKKKLIDEGYEVWKKSEPADIAKEESEWKSRYASVMGTAIINKQLDTLTYILNQ